MERPSATTPSAAADWLVAHRGWPDRHPENSLDGMRAVLAAGARFVEFDVQLTADGHAVVIHDDALSRLTGRRQRVTGLPLVGLRQLVTVSPTGASAPIPTLAHMLALLAEYPDATAFIEIKRQSIDHHGLNAVLETLLPALERAPCHVVLISFRWRALRRARQRSRLPVGWVIRPWSPLTRWLAGMLRPDYLLVHARRVPRRARPFWRGPWRWVVYGVNDLSEARALRVRGADLIEVDDLPRLLDADCHSGGL